MLYIASDYAGYTVKEKVKHHLLRLGVSFIDQGSSSAAVRNDFTDYIKPVVKSVRSSVRNRGILICGTGQGMVIGANRFRKIRATLVQTPRQARLARTHDNANVLVLSAWEVSHAQLSSIVRTWLKTRFIALSRRTRRLRIVDTWPQ